MCSGVTHPASINISPNPAYRQSSACRVIMIVPVTPTRIVPMQKRRHKAGAFVFIHERET
jgi:hypothetical protein